MRQKLLFLTALLGLCQPACAQDIKPKTGEKILPVVEKPIPLKQGDRIIFFGDSITFNGVKKGGYVTLMKDHLMEKHRGLKLELIGAGIGGNKVPDLQKRVDKEVVAKKPTIVFVYIGINDVWHNDFLMGTPKDKYEAGLKEVIGKIQAAGAKVVVCTPSVIGEKKDGSNKYDKQLDEFADVSRAVAKAMNADICDLRKGFLAQIKADNPKNKDLGILTTDRVHLNPAGNRLVAEMMLNILGETLPPPAPDKPEKKDEAPKKG
jgi:lysophospholipase L1-like esterase